MHVSTIRCILLVPCQIGAILLVCPLALHAPVQAQESRATPAPVRQARLFARGYLFENDKPSPMAVVSIDPQTGAWKSLLDNSRDSFKISPDGETITFGKDGALWNGDAATNANPGKVFAEAGHVTFSPDSRTMLVTTWKGPPDKPEELEATVWSMKIDGTLAVPIAALAGWDVRDWSADNWLLTVDRKQKQSIHVMRSDGKEQRKLLNTGQHPSFSPDGQKVLYLHPWQGTIRAIGFDGSNDRLILQAPGMVCAFMARWSPDGKQLAALFMDLQIGDNNQPTLTADVKVANPRIVIVDVGTGDQRVLKIPQQEGRSFYPFGNLEWR
jgi:Tol biopolymer transport system component